MEVLGWFGFVWGLLFVLGVCVFLLGVFLGELEVFKIRVNEHGILGSTFLANQSPQCFRRKKTQKQS